MRLVELVSAAASATINQNCGLLLGKMARIHNVFAWLRPMAQVQSPYDLPHDDRGV